MTLLNPRSPELPGHDGANRNGLFSEILLSNRKGKRINIGFISAGGGWEPITSRLVRTYRTRHLQLRSIRRELRCGSSWAMCFAKTIPVLQPSFD